ncbi:MAG: RHS repeat-associated core domain-containing protein [Paracoccus sp. (in: a-proteobacteria)]
MSGMTLNGMTIGAFSAGGFETDDRPPFVGSGGSGGSESDVEDSTGTNPAAISQYRQEVLNQAAAETSPGAVANFVDGTIATYNSAAVQDFMLYAPIVVAGAGGALAASAAGTTGFVALAGAASTAAMPVLLGTAAAYYMSQVGFGAGENFGHWAMDAMGFERIAEDGEMPATVGHPIAHAAGGWSFGALVLGAVAAVAVGALIIASAGTAAPFLVLCVTAVAAGGAAGLIGGLGAGFASAAGQYGSNKGKIETGSPNVFFRGKPVARVTDVVDCSDHAVSKVAEGAETVFANDLPIARIGHKTTCDGTINDGVPDIAIDIDTSAHSLPIDVGWLSRAGDLTVMILDWLPIGGRGSKGDETPSFQTRGETPAPTCTRVGCPVNVATGRFSDSRTDLVIPGTINLELIRTHAVESFGQQGKGWAGTWAQHLRIEAETVTFQDPDGCLITFHTPRDEVLARNLRHPHLELLGRRSAELFVYDRRVQQFLVFADEGGDLRRLSRIEDRNGNRISFLYGPGGLRRVEHSDGFALRVHSHDGLIRSATLDAADGEDCVFSWDYTRTGQLREVRSSQTGTLRYDHDELGRIIGWTDGVETRVNYDYGPDGLIWRIRSDSGYAGVELEYDTANRRTVTRTADGAVKIWDWNADRLVWRETDPLGQEWLTEWDNAFHITAQTDPLGHRSVYDYDRYGNLIRVSRPDGTTQQWEYDHAGQLSTCIDAAGHRSSMRHDANGNLVGMTDALGRVTSFGLGPKGELRRVDMPGDVQVRIQYDPLMRADRRTDPDGNQIRMLYDTEGRLLRMTDPVGATILYDRARNAENPLGALRAVETADGATTRLAWNEAGALTAITDPNGTTRHFRAGAFGLPLESVDARGHRLRFEHDSEMRLTAVINELGARFEFAYDLAGRMVAQRDYAGMVTRFSHDAVGRPIQRVAPDGAVTDYEYSAIGQLLVVRLRGRDDLPDAVTRFEYDARGLMIRASNAEAVVEYEHDALGRITTERLNGREIVSEYSVAGQRIARSGDVLHLTAAFSRAGLPVEMRIAGHEALRFQHDPRGLEQLRHSGAGFALAQGHTVTGRLAEQIAGPFARLPEEARSAGLSSQAGPEFASRAGARVHRSYDWDQLGRAIRINDRLMGDRYNDYDALGQVATTRRDTAQGQSVLRHFEYDPASDLTTVIAAGRAQPVETQAGRVRRRGQFFYRHDDCGRVIEKRHEEPGFRPRVWRMVWNGHDQLIGIETPDGAHWRYGYDPFGRRITRQSDGGESYAMQWEGDRQIAEAPMTADGTVAWQDARHWVYEGAGFRPLAQIQGETLHYIVTDHLGTPRELLSEDGETVAWRAELTLWGDMAELRLPRRAANDDSPPADCPIRFQGQWHDAESGLHYNRLRYYDPDATQYLSPDPIGINGGTRPQAYVDDPNASVDPLGLAPLTPGDFGTGTLTDDPALHKIWLDSLRKATSTGRENAYTRVLDIYESGGQPTYKQLERAFSYVNSKYFLPDARDAGYTIKEVHHWNFSKGDYPAQVFDPRNLVPTETRQQHTDIHRATTGNPSNIWAGPIAEEHRLNIPDIATPIPPGYFDPCPS